MEDIFSEGKKSQTVPQWEQLANLYPDIAQNSSASLAPQTGQINVILFFTFENPSIAELLIGHLFDQIISQQVRSSIGTKFDVFTKSVVIN